MIAGAIARVMRIAGSAEYSIASIFSPFSSFVTAFMRTPLVPTVAPTGSTLGEVATSATLARSPGILALAAISTRPSLISGTSAFSRASRNFGDVRLSSTLIPIDLSI